MLADCLAPDLPPEPDLTAEQTLAALLAISDLTPADPALHREVAQAYRAVGQELEALVEENAAMALEHGMPLVLFNIATAYFTNGYHEAAARWYRLAVTVEPTMAIAHQNLACILFDQGRKAEAQHHRDCAYRQQCLFSVRAPQERRRVLVLGASGYGNIPLRWLLPSEVNSYTTWFVEYTTPQTQASLPDYDIVLNSVGDPDLDGPTYAVSCAFLDTCPTPWLNHPSDVSHTRRDRLPALLAGIDGVDVPPVLRAHPADKTVSGEVFGFPLLLRPAASHGGDGLLRLEEPRELLGVDWASAEAWYLSPFRVYRSPDGYWRKYRVIYVGGQPYPYHLAISSHWLVHYVTADMLCDPAKCAEERRFLDAAEDVLGSRAWAAIGEIGRRLKLDYAGVDFTLLPDGRVLVFEANATMLVHPEDDPALAYKNPFVTRITDAFDALLTQRIASAQPKAA